MIQQLYDSYCLKNCDKIGYLFLYKLFIFYFCLFSQPNNTIHQFNSQYMYIYFILSNYA